MRIVFFGTPLFAAKVLEFLLENKIGITAVISKPDKAKGRSGNPIPTPVKSVALAQNPPLPIYQPEIVSSPEFADVMNALDADLFIVVAYGEIIKQHLLEMPRKACINLHTSLLPKYRGAAPIQRSLIQGESETGVTIMHMVRKMDAGDLIEQVRVPIGPDTTFGELEEALCEAGKEVLMRTIHAFEHEQPPRTAQDNLLATLAPKIELEDCEISWNLSAHEIHNLVRGVNPYPGAWCYVLVKGEKKRLKILKTKIVPSIPMPPATLLNPEKSKGNLIIATGGDALELLDVQLEGKKVMSSDELTRGIPSSSLNFMTKFLS